MPYILNYCCSFQNHLTNINVYIGAGAASPRGYVHKEPKLEEAKRLAASVKKTLAAKKLKSHGTGKKPPFARKPAYKPSGSADSRGSGARKPPDLDAVIRQLRAVSTKVDNLTHCMLGTNEAAARREFLVNGVKRSQERMANKPKPAATHVTVDTDEPADIADDSEVEGGYDEAFSDWGGEEQDFSLARSGGKNLTASSAVVPDVVELENSMQSLFTACVFATMHPQSQMLTAVPFS